MVAGGAAAASPCPFPWTPRRGTYSPGTWERGFRMGLMLESPVVPARQRPRGPKAVSISFHFCEMQEHPRLRVHVPSHTQRRITTRLQPTTRVRRRRTGDNAHRAVSIPECHGLHCASLFLCLCLSLGPCRCPPCLPTTAQWQRPPRLQPHSWRDAMAPSSMRAKLSSARPGHVVSLSNQGRGLPSPGARRKAGGDRDKGQSTPPPPPPLPAFSAPERGGAPGETSITARGPISAPTCGPRRSDARGRLGLRSHGRLPASTAGLLRMKTLAGELATFLFRT